MALFLIFGLFLSGQQVFAQVTTKLSSEIVDVGQKFYVEFNIPVIKKYRPYVRFKKKNVNVLAKKEIGFFRLRNNKFVYRIRFIFKPKNARQLRIFNIKVLVGKKTFNVRDIYIPIQKIIKQKKDIFLEASVTKRSVLVGEGFNVNYFLFYRKPVLSKEFKKFPKLNGFLKRFHMVKEKPISVNRNSRVYNKLLVYTARLYAQKEGALKIDSLKMNIKYRKNRSRIGGSFLFNLNRSIKSLSLSSPVIRVNSRSVGFRNSPRNFSGLIGKHQVSLKILKTNFKINEPIELTLMITGEGLLETFEAPKIILNDSLEDFDTKGEVKEINRKIAKKTFSYVFLGREESIIKEKLYVFSFFNPKDNKFITARVKIPQITINKKGGVSKTLVMKKDSYIKIPSFYKGKDFLAPMFSYGEDIFPLEQIFLFFAILFLIGFIFREFNLFGGRSKNPLNGIPKIKDNNSLTYKNIFKILNHPVHNYSQKFSMVDRLNKLDLSDDCNKYFQDIIIKLEYKYNHPEISKDNVHFEKKYFTEFYNRVKNERL